MRYYEDDRLWREELQVKGLMGIKARAPAWIAFYAAAILAAAPLPLPIFAFYQRQGAPALASLILAALFTAIVAAAAGTIAARLFTSVITRRYGPAYWMRTLHSEWTAPTPTLTRDNQPESYTIPPPPEPLNAPRRVIVTVTAPLEEPYCERPECRPGPGQGSLPRRPQA